MKLPDLPEYAIGPTIDGVRYKPPSLSTTQLLAIQREAYIAGLEEAARVATATVCDTHLPTGVKIYGTRAGAAIRALKGEIE